jgi:hydroxymethylpyrimidine/phosphomethylpyrimidine kinase
MKRDHGIVCLTIAGLDPSGGAGVVADVKTFTAFGCFAAAAVTSVTFQNTVGVFGAEHESTESVGRQIETVLDDYEVAAIKIGMLPTRQMVAVVASTIRERKLTNIVVDPVVRSTSGFALIDNEALRASIELLFPLATLVTPNIPETELITGIAIESEEDIRDAAAIMRGMGARNVLIKGGHLVNAQRTTQNAESRRAVDRLFLGKEMHEFAAEWVETASVHGTGCVLSSAVAANLARGSTLIHSIDAAKIYVTSAIRTAPNIGRGKRPAGI